MFAALEKDDVEAAEERAQVDCENRAAHSHQKVECGWLHLTYRTARRIFIAFAGSIVVLTGVVMFVTPGPALVVIPIGLAILATEFEWARRVNRRLKERAIAACEYARAQGSVSSKLTRGLANVVPRRWRRSAPSDDPTL